MSTTAVLIPYYNGEALIQKCLKSLDCKEKDVWIIDNSESPAEFEDSYSHVITQKKRLGFAKTVNIGLKKVTEAGYQHVIVLNQDAYFRKGDFTRFVNVIEEHPNHFCCPILYTENFVQEIPFVKERYFQRGIPVARKEVRDYVGVVIGGHLNLFNSLDGFDERFFMYFEENDLFKRAPLSLPVIIDPEIHVAHRNKEEVMGKEELRWFYESEAYFARKHEGLSKYIWLRTKGFLRRVLKVVKLK